jgi:penicillin-binding protein 2
MGVSFNPDTDKAKSTFGPERIYVRLAIVGMLIVVVFVALFSRLWFLQVLAAEDYRQLARNNRIRLVYSEPSRGRILDSHGEVLVKNRESLAVTVDRQIVDTPREQRRVLRRLAKALDLERRELEDNLLDTAASPYKPVAVAHDVPERKATWILERQQRFPGVDVEELPVRSFPMDNTAAHILGYVGEISPEDLESTHFRGTERPYAAGDLVGKAGLEYYYDRFIRGRPEVTKVVVNSLGEVVGRNRITRGADGRDLVLSVDARIQKLTERALRDGITAARGAGYQAPDGSAVVMDPDNGRVVAMASYPTFDPAVLADGITNKEFDKLGQATPDDPDDDRLLNRAIQIGAAPGSSFKAVTAGAAMWSGIATPYWGADCDPSIVLPPEGGPGSVVFPNWSSSDYGWMSFPESLEVSCDTFYYRLGWDMEQRFGPRRQGGDGSERFQRYMRLAGFGRETGVDLRYEFDGRVPDDQWCEAVRKDTDGVICPYGWLPGMTVNMAIGQGDLLVSPLQMAVTYAAIANGGKVWEPRLGMALARTNEGGEQEIVRTFKPKVARRLPLDAAELAVIHQGLLDVVSGDQGTAASAFAGFPTGRYPVAGKTGTAQIGEAEALNRAWFVAYAPADDPEYVIAVYLNRAGHGGESAAPVARQILEGIFGIDRKTDVQLGSDASG